MDKTQCVYIVMEKALYNFYETTLNMPIEEGVNQSFIDRDVTPDSWAVTRTNCAP